MSLKEARRLPVVSLAAEYLTIGHLLRRNILAYKAPPNQEGYDLICINPDPNRQSRVVRVQVKSRYQTDANGLFPMRREKLKGADYVVLVRLNVGYFYRRKPVQEGRRLAEFLTLPVKVARRLFRKSATGWQMLDIKGVDLSAYKDDGGFEQIARDLSVAYPGTPR